MVRYYLVRTVNIHCLGKKTKYFISTLFVFAQGLIILPSTLWKNTSQGHKAQANPTFDSGTKYNSPNYKSTTSYDRHTNSGLQPPPTLVNTPHPACHRHSPCPLTNSLPHPIPFAISHNPSHYRSTVPNPPPLHAIPYTTSSSSTPTQSLHPSLTSALAPQTHYLSFSPTIIPPQSHTPHLNTQDGYQRTTQRGTIANDHIFLWEVMKNVQQQLNNVMTVMSPVWRT